MMDDNPNLSTLQQDVSLLIHDHVLPCSDNLPSLPTELWIEIISYLDLDNVWLNIRPCCLLFHAISIEITHRIIRTRINNLCSVHGGNQLNLTTPHFHWNQIPSDIPTHSKHITWPSLPEDQHPDLFLRTTDSIPTCFSLYLASEMSWTYTLRIVFHQSGVEDDGVERWYADSDGGWEMYYGTIKGPMRRDESFEKALRTRRVCPTRCVVPLAGLVRMLLLGPDQGY